MADQPQSTIIEENPIGKGLDAFRTRFKSVCEGASVPCSPDSLEQLGRQELQSLVLSLISTLQILPAVRLLTSRSGMTLFSELARLYMAITVNNFELDHLKPLLRSSLAIELNDISIWDQVHQALTEQTPPPRSIHSLILQTPWSRNTGSLVNSSEFRQFVNPVLKSELERLYVGLPNFGKIFFGSVPDLETASEEVFRRCTEGDNPLFKEGWSGWPADAKESDVLTWFD
ncbi:hypothetical protein F66182_12016 [Fusarium sp. NRRL 66182]|nr:hypothetical protein F66182_12016 [Fusarium sp. NRRL 66182]